MNQQDLFLKISFDAYYPLEGKSVQQKTVKYGDDDILEYYVDGRKVDPVIKLFVEGDEDFIEDSSSIGVDLMTRENIWKEDPHFKLMDEIISRSKSSNE